MSFTGKDFRHFFALPNLYFHAATAYGPPAPQRRAHRKRDFLGAE